MAVTVLVWFFLATTRTSLTVREAKEAFFGGTFGSGNLTEKIEAFAYILMACFSCSDISKHFWALGFTSKSYELALGPRDTKGLMDFGCAQILINGLTRFDSGCHGTCLVLSGHDTNILNSEKGEGSFLWRHIGSGQGTHALTDKSAKDLVLGK